MYNMLSHTPLWKGVYVLCVVYLVNIATICRRYLVLEVADAAGSNQPSFCRRAGRL